MLFSKQKFRKEIIIDFLKQKILLSPTVIQALMNDDFLEVACILDMKGYSSAEVLSALAKIHDKKGGKK